MLSMSCMVVNTYTDFTFDFLTRKIYLSFTFFVSENVFSVMIQLTNHTFSFLL